MAKYIVFFIDTYFSTLGVGMHTILRFSLDAAMRSSLLYSSLLPVRTPDGTARFLYNCMTVFESWRDFATVGTFIGQELSTLCQPHKTLILFG